MTNEKDRYTIAAMQRWGGSFVQALAQAARRADAENLRRIKTTWPEYWREYGAMPCTLLALAAARRLNREGNMKHYDGRPRECPLKVEAQK